MRSFILSSGGDPFLSDFVLSLWKRFWYDEVDEAVICYNNHAGVPQETAYEFLRKWEKEPKAKIIYSPNGVGNGTPILQGILNTKADNIMLLEDDGFIFTPGVVNNWFNALNTGDFDLVGSPRYTAGEVAEAARVKYNLNYNGVGDHGFGWWPNFFVCKRSDLLRTDWRFASDKYPQGEYIKEIDHTMSKDEYTDTFTFACLQLRHMGLKAYEIPQNHCHPEDLDFQRTHEVMFMNGDPKYIHGGSLSSGWGGYLNKVTPPVGTNMEKKDIETRVAWWKIVSEYNTKEYVSFGNSYNDAIFNLINNCNLDIQRINKKIQLYKSLMKI